MGIENNGPESAYPGPSEKLTDTGEGHGSGLDQAPSEPKQGSDDRPEDWNPPPGNPESDDEAQVDREDDDEPKTDSLIDAE
ncbi:hypothetical protein K5D34_18660 [Pseudomonas cichorii]|nr:hypothetical protein [Pseudomonas cichorii]MBX8511709.1 hypothetical protein [Pseudomonas cichorii]MBX8526517.1 hypothetical protein [Pseudomonas cichorii]